MKPKMGKGQKRRTCDLLNRAAVIADADYLICAMDAVSIHPRYEAASALMAFDPKTSYSGGMTFVGHLAAFRRIFGHDAYEDLCAEIIVRQGLWSLIRSEAEAA